MFLPEFLYFLPVKEWMKHAAGYEILNAITLTPITAGGFLNVYKFLLLF
jgi:hypothetical protein